MPTQEEFIGAATSATRETHQAVPDGPSNTEKFGLTPSTDTIKRVNQSQTSQKLFEQCFGELGLAQLYAARASIARATGAANCGGMTCIAFNHIRVYSPLIRPITFINVDGEMGDDTHSFVAFNLPAAPHARIDNWGDDVVICDPWIAWLIGVTDAPASPLEKLGAFRPKSHCDWVDAVGYNQKFTNVALHLEAGE